MAKCVVRHGEVWFYDDLGFPRNMFRVDQVERLCKDVRSGDYVQLRCGHRVAVSKGILLRDVREAMESDTTVRFCWTPDRIIDAISDATRLDPTIWTTTHYRSHRCKAARYLYAYYCKKFCPHCSYQEISRILCGHKSRHATMIYANRTAVDKLASKKDPIFNEYHAACEREFARFEG